MKNPYYPTALGLYFNYLVHGMGVILMSLNMASLETLWQTNAAGVSIVISSLGIGRLSVLLFAGLLSDRFGRRPFIMLGMCCYMAFFFGILHTNNIIIAYVFGFLAGMANSFLDAGTYPSLMEAFPRSPGTANILIKAFVSSGQFLLPLIISLLVWAELWFGWSFMIAAGIMFINALFLYRCTFPPHPGRRLPVIKKTTSSTEHRCSVIPYMAISQWQRFIWLASGWHSTDNLLQACHTLCRSNYSVSTPWVRCFVYLLPLHSFVIPFEQQHYSCCTPLSHLLLCLPSACIPHFMW